jgi:hypothetical protein
MAVGLFGSSCLVFREKRELHNSKLDLHPLNYHAMVCRAGKSQYLCTCQIGNTQPQFRQSRIGDQALTSDLGEDLYRCGDYGEDI